MQQLIYNGVDLAALGVFRILGQTVVREPAEAPQRERVTYQVRLDFFEQSFAANQTLVEQLRAALKTQNAVLLWQDSGKTYLNRTVTAGEDEADRQALGAGGTYRQALVFSFWFYNHDVVTNCLGATVQRMRGAVLEAGAPLLALGAVEKWEEKLAATRLYEFADPRRKVEGMVTASGRFQADTTLTQAARQTALLALKDQLVTELVAGARFTLIFGTFNRAVRVGEFKVAVDQPNNYVAWTLSATYTAYPDESDYALLELKIQRRENLAEGIKYLNFSGKIQAPTKAAATARLALVTGALLPVGYVMLSTDIADTTQTSESKLVTTGQNQGDGAVFTELTFNLEYRDTSSQVCTYRRQAANTPVLSMGTVDKFSNRFTVTLFDEMRRQRKRAAGTVSMSGKYYAPETLTDAGKQSLLAGLKAQFDAEMIRGSSGTLVYGASPAPVLNQVVRLIDWDAQVNRLRNSIEWSLTAHYTAYPNESDYAMCEFQLGTRQNMTEGTVLKTLTGRIGAPSATAARSKLARLRSALIPSGYVLVTDGSEEHQVDAESDLQTTGQNKGDGTAFIELTINDEWQLSTGNVLEWTLRTVTEDEIKTGWQRITYSGTVRASAANQPAAFAAALAQAQLLGDDKYAFQVRSAVTSLDKLFQTTGGSVFVAVEFSYEYQVKGVLIFTEVVSELAVDTYGLTTETVSGMIAAPTLALARATYLTDVRNAVLFRGALILNERTPTLSQQRLDNEATALAAFDDRYPFQLQVLRVKDAGQTAMAYTTEVDSDMQAMEQTTTVRGTVWAASQTVAEAFVQTLLAGLTFNGKRVKNNRIPHFKQGPAVGGAGAVTIFESMEFTEIYVGLLTGLAGLLQTECSEDLVYSGTRQVEKPIPDGPSIIQQCGTTCGRRTVTCRAVGTTETATVAWVKGIRKAMLASATAPTAGYETAPNIKTGFTFLPQVSGVPRGTGANVKLYETNATFSELIPELVFSP